MIVVGLLLCGVAIAAPQTERVAVIDLGPGTDARRDLATAIVKAGLDPVVGNGIEDALAGVNVDKDAVAAAAALAEAQRAFGALDCAAAIKSSESAITILAMRQAAGVAVPELPRALTYVLLCKDKAGDVDGAMVAAARLRAVGGSKDVPADLWKKYPAVDTVLDHELVSLEIEADVKDARVFIDLVPRGKAPLRIQLPAGEHLIAVAVGTRRGWAAGHTDPKQAKVTIPTTDRAGESSPIATRIAALDGKKPSADDVAFVMGETGARIVLIRSADSVEAWGRVGRSEVPHLLGGEDGVAKVSDSRDVDRLLLLVKDRVQGWNDRAPDPDQPLLTEKPGDDRFSRKDKPAKWWVYAALAGAVAGAAAILYVNDSGSDRQRVELKFP
ncbi:MAG: hypothetical protein M4D80_22910 [Myxococcota bacterium]|nr:hypothetical protein [Myxococcota bacterium]